MQTRSQHLPRLFFTVTAFAFLGVGCASRSEPTPQQFADQYKALMVSYKSRMIALTSRPIPPKTVPKNKKRHRALLARDIDDVADANTEYATKLAALQAPASMLGLKSTTEAYFEVAAGDNHQWAEAMRSGDRNADQVEHQGEVNELAAMKNMQLALKGIGGASPKLQDAINAQQQQVNK